VADCDQRGEAAGITSPKVMLASVPMSAFRGKADITKMHSHVWFGSKADIRIPARTRDFVNVSVLIVIKYT